MAKSFISARAARKVIDAEDRRRRLTEKVQIFVFDLPPSANVYWRMGKGRIYVSDEAADYKEDVAKMSRQQGLKEPLEGDVAVMFRFYRARRSGDLDNKLKVLIDALKGIAYADDKQITELHAYRFDDPKNPRVEVEIAPN